MTTNCRDVKLLNYQTLVGIYLYESFIMNLKKNRHLKENQFETNLFNLIELLVLILSLKIIFT